jgi:hypothetical protein
MPFMPVRSVATGTAAVLKDGLPIILIKLPQYPAPCGQIQRSNPFAVTPSRNEAYSRVETTSFFRSTSASKVASRPYCWSQSAEVAALALRGKKAVKFQLQCEQGLRNSALMPLMISIVGMWV